VKSTVATFRQVAYTGLSRRLLRRAAVLHTNGAPAGTEGTLFHWWSAVAAGKHEPKVGRHIGAHFQITADGRIEQYVDTDLSLGHAFAANGFAIGIETEDDGHPGKPWPDAQLEAIVALLIDLEIPAQLLKVGASDGLGWHQQFDAWNESGHNCPGPVRVAQIRNEVIPLLKEGGVAKSDPYFEELEKDGIGPGEYSAVIRFQWAYQRGLRQKDLRPQDANDDVVQAGFAQGLKDAQQGGG
jgi:hypothetical protein